MNYCKECKHCIGGDNNYKGDWKCRAIGVVDITKREDPLTGIKFYKCVKYKSCLSIRKPSPSIIIEDCPNYKPNLKKRIKTWLTGKH